MTWEEMTNEILSDIVKIVAADNSVHHVVSFVQWHGNIIGRLVYQPSPFELVGNGGYTDGISMIPEPPAEWKAVELKFVPKADGKPSNADTPLAYFVDSEKGYGVAFPARFNVPGGVEKPEGKISWTHNPEVIEHVRDMLLDSGMLKLKLTEKSNA